MADYPCDWHLARYKGPSTRVYLNIFQENQEVRLKGSCCMDCLAMLVSEWLSRALHETAEEIWDPPEEDQELESLWKPSKRRVDPRFGRLTA